MTLEASYQYCSRIARSRAKNFYYGFICLPSKKRKAICAVYAFMRVCDDIADEFSSAQVKKTSLKSWSDQVEKCLNSQGRPELGRHFQDFIAPLGSEAWTSDPKGASSRKYYGKGNHGLMSVASAVSTDQSHPIFPALRDTVDTFKIPQKYLLELIEGVQMDLSIDRFSNFEDLYAYCYKVASIVGIVSLHIFGFKDILALQYAESCGIAFQLTNILRDLKEDAQMGRVYIPQSDLDRFSYSREDLLQFKKNSNFLDLMKFEVQRAEEYYRKGSQVIDCVDRDSRKALHIMIAIYHGILQKISKKKYDTFSQRISLNFYEKIIIILAGDRRLKTRFDHEARRAGD